MLISSRHKGPFIKAGASKTATYPTLWNHANAERRGLLFVYLTAQLKVRVGMEAKAAEIWDTASRAHLNRDFRFTSQPLTAAFTDQLSIGGVAWPNVSFPSPSFDYAFTVWANTTLGLLSFWWHSNRQQSGSRAVNHPLTRLPFLYWISAPSLTNSSSWQR